MEQKTNLILIKTLIEEIAQIIRMRPLEGRKKKKEKDMKRQEGSKRNIKDKKNTERGKKKREDKNKIKLNNKALTIHPVE